MIRLGSIRGTAIRLHPAFIVAALAAAGLCAGAHSWLPALFLPALFAAVAVHEMGHVLAARRLGLTVDTVTLHPLSNAGLPAAAADRPRDVIRIALAGPAANLIVAGAILLTISGRTQAPIVPAAADGLPGAGLWAFLLLFNGVLGVANLVPAFPGDAGRALHAALSLRLNRAAAHSGAIILSQLIAGLLAIASVARGSLPLGMWAVLIGISTAQEARRRGARCDFAGRTLRDVMVADPQTVTSGQSLRSVIDRFASPGLRFLPVMCGGEVLGVLRRDVVLHRFEHDPDARDAYVAAVMDRRVLTAAPDDLLEDIVSRHALQSYRPLLILEDGQLVGMVTWDSVQERIDCGFASPPAPPTGATPSAAH